MAKKESEKEFSVRMKDEKDGGFVLLSEGEHHFAIREVELVDEETSKSGKPYFAWSLLEMDEKVILKVFTTLIPGKRWLLKQLLGAVGIEANPDDPEEHYSFNKEDVINKCVLGTIKHRPNKYTNREGEEVENIKGEVVGFKKSDRTVDAEDEIPF